ncbi:hypothetical protein E5673_02375 [Sphingomonas sp. PAMC26645]|jgi:hypothetical protein|uniref:hypothetical protein n=1 Tax=Sphingomonas sp. PAMC26645 TaxID=2565555 RepID=UPI00109E0D1D|nr:hypothetical protein [Sphingomonas sp. PAMC26645]QCB41211.1 hypothetical protein E5673_02375 [Sphingomonas sp. PAMC26645]
MGFFSRFSPIAAYQDLRLFFSQRRPYELFFLAAALGVTSFLIYAFMKDSYVEKEYRPKIIYVEQWPADRTDAQIEAQQKIDAPIKAKALAEQKAREDAQRESFKRLDDKLKAMGI